MEPRSEPEVQAADTGQRQVVVTVDARTLFGAATASLLLAKRFGPRAAGAAGALVLATFIELGAAGITASSTAIASLLLREGFKVVARGGKGSHVKLRRDGLMVILPGNRKDLSPAVLRSVANALGVRVHELPRRASN